MFRISHMHGSAWLGTSSAWKLLCYMLASTKPMHRELLKLSMFKLNSLWTLVNDKMKKEFLKYLLRVEVFELDLKIVFIWQENIEVIRTYIKILWLRFIVGLMFYSYDAISQIWHSISQNLDFFLDVHSSWWNINSNHTNARPNNLQCRWKDSIEKG